METTTKVVLILLLSLFSIQDLRRREISILPVAAGILLLLFLRLSGVPEERDGFTWMLKLLPGVVYLFAAVLRADKVGYGDGVCMLMAGIALWPEELLYGLLGTLIPLLILLIVRRKKGGWKKEQDRLIPYIPVLNIGIILGVLWDCLGI